MDTAQNIQSFTFHRSSNKRFEISSDAWQVMRNFRQSESHMPEAGGVLLGRHLVDGSAIIVDAITIPMHGDRASRFRFYRDRRRHQAIIDKMWRDSNGTCTYLGEWHTHPERIPSPSSIDLKEWIRRLGTDSFSEPIFFVIVGIDEVAAWEGSQDGTLTRLVAIKG